MHLVDIFIFMQIYSHVIFKSNDSPGKDEKQGSRQESGNFLPQGIFFRLKNNLKFIGCYLYADFR